MKAIGKYLVIDPIKETSTKTEGGLILAEKQREDIRYRKAKVIVVGDDIKVLKEKDIEIKHERYRIIKENDVVVVL